MSAFDGVSIKKGDVKLLKGVDEALKNYYTEAVASAAHRSGVSEREVRDWIGSALITQGFRSAVTEGPTSGEAGAQVLDELESVHHLIRSESRASRTWYELSHDRLVDPIIEDNERVDRSLAPWLREAKKWADVAPASGLLTGSLLVDAERWLEVHPDAQLLPREQEFLDDSRTENKRVAAIEAAAARDRRRALVSYGLALLAVLLLAGAVVAAFWATDAQRQADAALAEREKAQDGLVEQTELARAAAVDADGERTKAEQEAAKALEAEQLAQDEAAKALKAEQLARDEAARALKAEQLAQDEAAKALESEQLAQEEAERRKTQELKAIDAQKAAEDSARVALDEQGKAEVAAWEAARQAELANQARAAEAAQRRESERQRVEAVRLQGVADSALKTALQAQEELGIAFDVLAEEVFYKEFCTWGCPLKDAQWRGPEVCREIESNDLRTQVRVNDDGSLIYLGTLTYPLLYRDEPDLPAMIISMIGPDGRHAEVLPTDPSIDFSNRYSFDALAGFVYIFEDVDGGCIGGIISDRVDFTGVPVCSFEECPQ